MVVKLANNASSTLAGAINSSVTSLSVASGDASKFPSLGAGEWFPLTVVDSAGNMEIMRVTARSGATLTVTRGQEGTTAKSFAAGSKCDIRLTAAAQVDHEHTISAIVGLVAALAAKADDSEIADLYTALGLKADASAVALALATKASLLSDGESDNTFADTSELAYVDGTTQKRGTFLGLISSIFNGTRAIANGIFLSASFAWQNAGGFKRTHNIAGHTADRATNWPDGPVTIPAGTLITADDVPLTTAALAAGAVGAYAQMFCTANSVFDVGSTRAGSGLRFASGNADQSSTVPSGTWRCMGYSFTGTASPRVTLWMRIS